MRLPFVAVALLAACGQPEPPPALPPPAAEPVAAPWFICDAIDAPVLLVFERDDANVRVAQYDKPNGALLQRAEYQIGDEESAAGSVYTSLMQNGADAGRVRQVNAGMLETPGAAYTQLYSSVRLGDREISCRWLPRTRLMGFTGRRTIVISEDGDGDLLYHSYDFATAAQAQQIEIAENGRTTTFSVEVRGGEERLGDHEATYSFRAPGGFTYSVGVGGSQAAGVLEVFQAGQPVQSEPLIAFQTGDAADP